MLIELFITFAKIGMFTFGGGYAMISLIEHECVENKQWITSDELMDVTVIAESTPGPIAINCATYTGYKKAGISGAIIATIGMILPSFLIILLISSFMDNLLKYELAVKAFHLPEDTKQIILQDTVSRKKQIIPAMMIAAQE